MDDKKQELTPEEKLLAVIQQGKQQEKPATSAASASPSVSVVRPPEPVAKASPAPAVPEQRATAQAKPAAPAPVPVEKKLKLAAEPVKAAVPVPAQAAPAVAAARLPPEPPPPPRVATPVRAFAMRRSGRMVQVNRVLAAVVLVLLVVVVYSIASMRVGVAEELGFFVRQAGAPEMPSDFSGVTNREVLPVEDFLGKVQGRDIFGLGKVIASTNIHQEKTEKPVETLKLMGISADSEAPERAMAIIRNKADNKTFFVTLGGTVGDTGYTLQRVLADRVILKSKKQELELK